MENFTVHTNDCSAILSVALLFFRLLENRDHLTANNNIVADVNWMVINIIIVVNIKKILDDATRRQKNYTLSAPHDVKHRSYSPKKFHGQYQTAAIIYRNISTKFISHRTISKNNSIILFGVARS